MKSLPKFNSGLAYFRSGLEADAVFTTDALDIFDRHDDFGIPTTPHHAKADQRCDEPALAAALAAHGIPAIADNGRGQGVTWDPKIEIEIDVLRGKCCYKYPSGFQYPLVCIFWPGRFWGRFTGGVSETAVRAGIAAVCGIAAGGGPFQRVYKARTRAGAISETPARNKRRSAVERRGAERGSVNYESPSLPKTSSLGRWRPRQSGGDIAALWATIPSRGLDDLLPEACHVLR